MTAMTAPSRPYGNASAPPYQATPTIAVPPSRSGISGGLSPPVPTARTISQVAIQTATRITA
jgi:hypothetical protein